MQIVNISAYKFVRISDPEGLRVQLQAVCNSADVRGTILLAEEGINLFLAGTRSGIDAVCRHLAADTRFADVYYKESLSEEIPFKKMLVKVKPEIITMGQPDIRPSEMPAPSLSPETLKTWLDEGREIIVLDTRNEFEVKVGTFKNAVSLNITRFREFPEATRMLDPSLKDKPVVTFCTGGIRCEKAAPWLLQAGFSEVYQLEGGILNYFEKVGGAHYDGECFVFDNRIAVDEALSEKKVPLCLRCQMPLADAAGNTHCVTCQTIVP